MVLSYRLTSRVGSLLLLPLVFGLLTVAWAQPYSEAPQLAQLVEAGQLPPVEERLPVEPMVVPVIDRIGQYGGDWRMGMLGPADTSQVYMTAWYDQLVRWNLDWTGVEPNIAKSWDVNEDATEYIFTLREGMKWSDGKPFTSADILFWAEDVAGNPQLSPAGQPSWMQVDGQPATFTAPDDYTVVVAFPAPNALFLQRLASPGGEALTSIQSDYASQFHINYNEQADELAREQGFADWVELFQNKVLGWEARIDDPELPTLTAWMLVTPLGQRLVLERNPYYWKVDPEGNQLPYLDRVLYPLIEDPEVLLLQALGGDVDFMVRHIGEAANRPILFDTMERGNYRLYDMPPSHMNTQVIFLNLAHRDPVLREIFQNKLFRQALSVAIDREEIIDLIHVGQTEPWQAAPRPESEFYDEEMAKQFTQHDPEQANAWLDELGYSRGSDGWRLGPDGQPITFVIEVLNGFPAWADQAEMVAQYWQEVGVRANVRVVERSLLYTRKGNNDHDVIVWGGDGGLDVLLEPRSYFPFSTESNQGIPWAIWYIDPNNPLAEEPPAKIKMQMELYDHIKVTPDPQQQAEAMREILQIAKEEFYVMGVALSPDAFGIVKNDFHNVPETMFFSWLWPRPGPAYPEQFFISH